MAADDTPTDSILSIEWQGRTYRLEDLTLNDVAELEDEFGETIEQALGSNRMRPMLYMVWLIRRRTEPDLTLEDVGEMSVADMVTAREEAGDSRPPTPPAAKRKKSAGGGSRGTRASSASGRGNSDS